MNNFSNFFFVIAYVGNVSIWMKRECLAFSLTLAQPHTANASFARECLLCRLDSHEISDINKWLPTCNVQQQGLFWHLLFLVRYVLPPLILKIVLESLGHHDQAKQCTSSGKFFVEPLVTLMDQSKTSLKHVNYRCSQNNAVHILSTKITMEQC